MDREKERWDWWQHPGSWLQQLFQDDLQLTFVLLALFLMLLLMVNLQWSAMMGTQPFDQWILVLPILSLMQPSLLHLQ